MKSNKLILIPAIVLAISLIVCITAFALQGHIVAIGENVGEASGTLVGTVVGSWNGITEGIGRGAEDGTAAGLSAKDTEVNPNLFDSIQEVGKLEVLVAGVRLTNFSSIGETYKALYAAKGDAVFSVDLTQAEITSSETEVSILIPEPELELYLDESSTEKLAETQNFSWTVGTKDGITAYLNSVTQMKSKIEETMLNYDSLMKTAREAAISQATQLAEAATLNGRELKVDFK